MTVYCCIVAVCGLVRQQCVSTDDDVAVATRYLVTDVSDSGNVRSVSRIIGREEIKASLALCNKLHNMLKLGKMLKSQNMHDRHVTSTLPAGKRLKVRRHIQAFWTDYERVQQLACQRDSFASSLRAHEIRYEMRF